ncbi:hypothetical protein BJ165DRAFT_1410159 [Panaeolus papilionaceus]|nr:hypothetical protein BJ165DRAFT_1410159 [Panaeolus papilionaceus]
MKIKPTRTSHVKIRSSTHSSPSVAIPIKQPLTIDVVQNFHTRTKPQTTSTTLSQNIAHLLLEDPRHNDKETPHSLITRIYCRSEKKSHQLEKQVERPAIDGMDSLCPKLVAEVGLQVALGVDELERTCNEDGGEPP